MSRTLIITFNLLAFTSTSCSQKTTTHKKQSPQIEHHKSQVKFELRDSTLRNTLIKLCSDSIVVEKFLRDAVIREVFGKPVLWDSGEFVSISSTLQIPQKPLGWTTDYEEIFTPAQVDTLNSMISQFERETTIEIAIITIDSSWIAKEKFDSSVLAIGNLWSVGKKDKNNGIVIGISIGLRMIRISNGYGIEQKLPDEETKKIIDETIIPNFKEGKYFEGVQLGLVEIMRRLR